MCLISLHMVSFPLPVPTSLHPSTASLTFTLSHATLPLCLLFIAPGTIAGAHSDVSNPATSNTVSLAISATLKLTILSTGSLLLCAQMRGAVLRSHSPALNLSLDHCAARSLFLTVLSQDKWSNIEHDPLYPAQVLPTSSKVASLSRTQSAPLAVRQRRCNR